MPDLRPVVTAQKRTATTPTGGGHELLDAVADTYIAAPASSVLTTRALAAAAVVVALWYHAALLRHVRSNAHFSGDDIITFCSMRELRLSEFLLTPINEHFVPLHRLVAYLANTLAPTNFEIALFILTAFHGVGVVYLHGSLRLLERLLLHEDEAKALESRALCVTQSSWLLLGLYASHVYLSPLYGWWTAGLHRLPFIAFALMSAFYYLRARDRGGWQGLALAAACMLASLGFFVKGVLVPFYLAGLELCLWLATRTAPRRKNVLFLLGSAGMGACFLLLWRHFQPEKVVELNLDLKVQADFLAANALIVRDGAVGSVFTGDLFDLANQRPAERWLASALWLGAILYTVAKRPSNALVWLVLCVLLLPNVLLVSLSKFRTGDFGVLAALVNQRYYFELYFPVVLCVAVATLRLPRSRTSTSARNSIPGRRTSGTKKVPRPDWCVHRVCGALAPSGAPQTRNAPVGRGTSAPRSWLTATAASMLLVLVASNAYSSSRQLIDNAQSKRFIERLQTDAARAGAEVGFPIPIVESRVPPHVVAWPPKWSKASVVLPALGVDVVVAREGAPAYQLLSTGELSRAPSSR
ncbi:MAG TPA: hypothetical protein VI072_08490 [Polyangiaceae bacterium]